MEGPGFDGMLAKAQAQWAIEREVLLKRLEDLKRGPGTKHCAYDRHWLKIPRLSYNYLTISCLHSSVPVFEFPLQQITYTRLRLSEPLVLYRQSI